MSSVTPSNPNALEFIFILFSHLCPDVPCGPSPEKFPEARLEVFTAMVFWVATHFSDVVEYPSFGGPCCLQL